MLAATPRMFLATRRRRPLRSGGLIVAVLAGQAMASLDASIVNVAAPTIQYDLHISGAVLQLAVYAYLLPFAAGLITTARLGARHGFGVVFTIGVVIFTTSSLVCGVAVGPAMLVGARAVQGLGAALMVPQVLSLLQISLEGERRRRALSLYGMVLAAGVAAGQVLGGLLVGANLLGAGWRPIFLVNLPIGIAVLVFAGGRLPSGARARSGRLNITGAVALAAATLALLVPLSFGAAAGWPLWCWPVFATGAGLLVWFARHGRRLAQSGRTPLIDPSLLGRGGVRAPLTGIFALMACYGGLLFTTALYLQRVVRESPLHSGLTFAAYAAGFAIASLTWTKLPTALHSRVPTLGFGLISAATAGIALATRGGWPLYATALLAVAGAGHGAGFGALVRRAAADVAPEHAASLSGVLATVNQIPVAVGVAAFGTLYLSLTITATLLALAVTEAAFGTAVTVALARRSHARRPVRTAASPDPETT
jgi:MFS family permease